MVSLPFSRPAVGITGSLALLDQVAVATRPPDLIGTASGLPDDTFRQPQSAMPEVRLLHVRSRVIMLGTRLRRRGSNVLQVSYLPFL
jgi:hypothetical protein